MLRGLLALVVAGTISTVLALACTSAPPPDLAPPPPSEAAAPWVGCYLCNTSITGVPLFYFPEGGGWGIDGSTTLVFTNRLSIAASADTLTGQVTDLDGGWYDCELQALVVSDNTATLSTSSKQGPWNCPIETRQALLSALYDRGTFVLDGSLAASLAVSFQAVCNGGPLCDDAGMAAVGKGTQLSSCARVDASACPAR